MKQGAVITGGLMDWQIVQQVDGFARVKVAGWFFVAGLSTSTRMAVLARVVQEADGQTVIDWTQCTVDGLNFYGDLRIPQGGLYRLETVLSYEGANGLSVTRGDMVHHFGVGDVYIIAGQSNAAGRAKDAVLDPPELGVHLLRPGGVWDLASHPLHETTKAVLLPEMENNNPSHSPFLRFGKRLRERLGIPIGLIPLAKGGAGLWQWNPDEEGGLYRHMLSVIRDCCPRVRGVLWYQGCADAFERKGDSYASRFERMVAQWRKDLSQPSLPFITVQLGHCTLETDDALDLSWGKVREAQRQAALSIPAVQVVTVSDLPLFDTVHLSAAANLSLGDRMASAALSCIYGLDMPHRAPSPLLAERVAPNQVRLLLCDAPVCLTLPDEKTKPLFSAHVGDYMEPASVVAAEEGALRITFARPLMQGARLCGLWQMNPAMPPVCPETNLPLMSFFDLEII